MNTCRQALIRTPNLFRLKQVPYFYILFAMFFTSFYSCSSTPKETEPVAQDQQNQPDELQQLKDLEQKAKGAIARAEAAKAAELSPELLIQAYQNLRSGQEKDPKKDGGVQKDQYLDAIEKANQAYEKAISQSRSRWLTVIGKYEADLEKLNAPLYMPKYNSISSKLLQQLRNKIATGDTEESLALYQYTIPNVDAVITALEANLDWLDQLSQEVDGLAGEASRQNQNLQGAAKKLEQQGLKARNSAKGHDIRGDMQSMEQDLYDARYYLREALRSSGALDPTNIDALLRSVQKNLENASERTVVDAEGKEIRLEKWRGDTYLEKNPLVDLSKPEATGRRSRDRSKLQSPQVSNDFQQKLSQQAQKIHSLKTAISSLKGQVLEPLSFQADWQIQAVTQRANDTEPENLEEQNQQQANSDGQNNEQENDVKQLQEFEYVVDDDSQNSQAETEGLFSDAQLLIKQAISSWKNGVNSRNNGNLPKARHYFEEAARLTDQYNIQFAIQDHYVVRKLKPEDCLWRIAGYEYIYADPYQWTRIYQRNRNIISNPSLIYPGQRFVIPPLKENTF